MDVDVGEVVKTSSDQGVQFFVSLASYVPGRSAYTHGVQHLLSVHNGATVTLFSVERQTSGAEIFDSASLQVTSEIYDGVTSQFTRSFRDWTNTHLSNASFRVSCPIRNYFWQDFEFITVIRMSSGSSVRKKNKNSCRDREKCPRNVQANNFKELFVEKVNFSKANAPPCVCCLIVGEIFESSRRTRWCPCTPAPKEGRRHRDR